jgi:hypothetical protein
VVLRHAVKNDLSIGFDLLFLLLQRRLCPFGEAKFALRVDFGRQPHPIEMPDRTLVSGQAGNPYSEKNFAIKPLVDTVPLRVFGKPGDP